MSRSSRARRSSATRPRSPGRLSPDGKWLSLDRAARRRAQHPRRPGRDPAAARPLTTETKRPIRQYFWSPDSRQILFINDKGGDENFLLYGVDVVSGAQRTLTPFEKTRVQIVGISNDVKDRILVGVNNRDPKWHDVHSLDLASGKLTPVLINTGGYPELPRRRAAQRPRRHQAHGRTAAAPSTG